MSRRRYVSSSVQQKAAQLGQGRGIQSFGVERGLKNGHVEQTSCHPSPSL